MLLFVVCFWLSTSRSLANSESDYNQFLADYRNYQNLLSPFNVSRSKYLTYKSVVSQGEYLTASKNLLRSEITSLIKYAVFLKTYLNEATQISDYNENLVNVKLDELLANLQTFLPRIESADSLNSIQSIMAELKVKYTLLEVLSYQSKAAIETAGIKKIYGNLGIEKSLMGEYLDSIKKDSVEAQAAMEKYNNMETDYNNISNVISQAYNLQSSFNNNEYQEQPSKISAKIRTFIDSAVESTYQLVLGYQNILFALKQ